MKSILRSSQLKYQLSIEGRWADLERHFERTSKTYRPFVWLHQRYVLPGAIPVQHALFLQKHGRHDEALVKIDQAIHQIKGKPWFFKFIHRAATFKNLCGALRSRTMILTALGRYDDARETNAELQRRAGPGGLPNAGLALMEYYCGRLDEALALAEAVPQKDTQYESMRGIKALVHSTKGEFNEAIEALMFEPRDISKFYSPDKLQRFSETTEGAKFLELQFLKFAGVSQPARLLQLAQVYLAQEDFENAVHALDQAEKLLGPEPGIQFAYCRCRACSLAGLGKAGEAENYIERMHAIVAQVPKRGLLWEMHYSTARSYLYLGRCSDALAKLNEAKRYVLHPIEKHATAYLTGKTHETAGNFAEAIPLYQIVAADSIPSWMRKRAADFLAQRNG